MPFTRRDLLSRGALLVASGFLAPAFITRTAAAMEDPGAQVSTAAGSNTKNKILVVLQLSGGNDGLDILAPVDDPSYASLRGSLALKPSEVLTVGSGVGLHPGLPKLKAMFDSSRVAVIQGVGYPNPNRSHFRSMDIWHSARPDVMEKTGWLGRYIDACQCSQSGIPGISVGDQLNTMFWTDTSLVPAVASIGAFSFLTDTQYKNDRTFQLQTLQNIYNQAGNWPASEALIRRGTVAALSASDDLQKVASSYQTPIQYPKNNGLASQLQLVAQVIAGNLGTRLFSVSMGGFDTHAGEKQAHARLYPQIDDAVDAFMQDLANIGRQDDVVIMTFSEFGRRAKPNGSDGTDHGTAAPMFVIGNGVKGGLYGSYPSLSDLDKNGDLKFSTDFRSVYAGVLRDHVGVTPDTVLAGSFPAVPFMKSALGN